MFTKKCLVKSFGFIPSGILFALALWSYYAYVISFGILYLCYTEYLPLAIVLILLLHVFFIPLIVSFYRVVFNHPGKPPEIFQIEETVLREYEASEELHSKLEQHFGKEVQILLRDRVGKIRYCEICKAIKPDRTHHCSLCEECVCKYDHHCPWVNNCIGYRNYKFFLLLLFHGLLYTLYIIVTLIPLLAKILSQDGFHGVDFQWLLLALFAICFCFALTFFLGYHLKLVLTNTTTIEDMNISDTNVYKELGYWPFNVNKRVNMNQVFGENKWFWFIPTQTTKGDGTQFPLRERADLEQGESLLRPSIENSNTNC